MKNSLLMLLLMLPAFSSAGADAPDSDGHSSEPATGSFPKDVIKAKSGDLTITRIDHATLMFQYKDLVVHVDPWSKLADYSKLPPADIILITHDHSDHLDPVAIKAIRKDTTIVVATKLCADKITSAVVMSNGDEQTIKGLKIEAVPAYNMVNKRPDGAPYHPKGAGNGYVISFGDLRVYVAGDTENIPEMKNLKNIDVAFLPMNLPYTMTPEMVASAARSFKPRILYPYHYGDTDTQKLVDLLRDEKEIDVRILQKK